MKFWLSRSEPLRTLKECLPYCQENGMNVTIQLTDADYNREVSVRGLEELERDIRDRKLTAFCYLPYHGLALSCPDSRVMSYSREVLQEGLEIGTILGARVAVLQTGFSNHIRPNMVTAWKERFIESMRELVTAAEEEEVVLALKNTFEPDGSILLEILQEVNSPWLRFCADLGHAACFSRVAPDEWVRLFGDHLISLGFHDNEGLEDEHRACGQGFVGYEDVFAALQAVDVTCNITLDVGPEDIAPSIEHLTSVGFTFEKGEIPDSYLIPQYDPDASPAQKPEAEDSSGPEGAPEPTPSENG